MVKIHYKIAIIILLLFAISPLGKTFAQIDVTLPTLTRAVGASDEYVALKVGNIQASDNVTAFGFDVHYDTSIIYISDITRNGSSISGINNGLDVFNAHYSATSCRYGFVTSTPISGSGTLVMIKFHYKKAGSTKISFNGSFKFNSGTPAANQIDGMVTILGALPTITLNTPNGGENWQAKSIQNITWSSSNVTNIKIEYSLDAGTSWTVITSSVAANSGSYTWILPDTVSTQAKVRIIDTSDSTYADTSNGVFTISGIPTIKVKSPNGGESWQGGSSQNITWSSANVTNVKIELTLNDGQNWTTIASSTPASSGSYNWIVMDTSSSQAKIRVTDVSNSSVGDTSDNVFTITRAPKITVTAPNGGESWTVGTIHQVTWTSVNVSNVKIDYSINNGSTWNLITSSTPASNGSYDWTIPDSVSSQAKVRISDVSNSAVADTSNSVFEIIPVPEITVISPNGGETWIAGSSHSITWKSASVSNVKIELSVDNGASWSGIVNSTPANTGSYNWTVPNISSTQAEIRISDVNNSTLGDTSDNTFTIKLASKLTLTSPNGGEVWQGLTTHNITWTSTNVNNVKLEFSLDKGVNWNQIVATTDASTGTYEWKVPDTSSTTAEVRISDVSDASIGDTSNAVFSITLAPKITVVSPNGNETWQAKSSQSIMWTSINVSNVKIEFSLDNGADWNTIVASTPSTGSYNWTLPDTSSQQAIVKISDVSDSSVTDVSNGVFTISPVSSVNEFFNSNLPKKYSLFQNFPNPFNPVTNIYYSIPRESYVIIKVYNVLGKEVATLVNKEQTTGNYSVQFDASKLTSGIYLYRIQAGNYTDTKKLILMK